MYPVSSSKEMRKKSSRICGKKTIVPEIPPMTPSTNSPRNGPSSIEVEIHSPTVPNATSIHSIGT
jgi:hypothetical protein